ncbi:MAG TPA: hypothetical protein PLB01_00145 [Thermoanaerobaculia bacterium]|nr:hypothetical protein [Thermoanaerobaculia bacterium]
MKAMVSLGDNVIEFDTSEPPAEVSILGVSYRRVRAGEAERVVMLSEVRLLKMEKRINDLETRVRHCEEARGLVRGPR